MSRNRRRLNITEREVENKIIDVVVAVAILFFCTSLMLLSLADHACGPAAHAVPSGDVVHWGAMPPPYPQDLADSKRASGALSAELAYIPRVKR
jgi:hypothetical protein